MSGQCSTCFYQPNKYESDDSPCWTCNFYDKWVAKDFLKNVPDTHVGKTIFSERQQDIRGHTYDSLRYATKAGVKFDQDKPQWTLVPFKALDEVVKVLTIGAKKYAPDNWKKVPNARQRYIDAAFRHMSAYAAGEKLDDETGKSHLAHAMCCLLFLLAFDLDKTLEKTNG